MPKTRTQNVMRNMWVGTLFQIISLILGFVNRTIFIKILGAEYLGLNSLFTNILTILSFAELGIGNAIIFSMYKPLSTGDEQKLKKLTNFYKQTYLKIGTIMLVVGLSITPFVPRIIESVPKISESIYLIYILFVVDSAVSYFFSYRTCIITADQKNYIIITYTHIFKIAQMILQLVILYFTHNYMLYLILQITNTIITQIFLSYKSKKMYPYLKEINNEHLEDKEKKSILNNVKTLFIYKFGSVILNGTDSIIISKKLGLTILGLYSNYLLIINALAQIISQVLNAFTSSIGNLIAQKDVQKDKSVFFQLFYFTIYIYAICGCCLYLLFNDFITIWLGPSYLLSNFVVAMIVLHLCVNGIQFAAFTFRNASGEFNHYKYSPIYSAVLNIVLSLYFAKIMGLGGIFLATTISRLTSATWIDPVIIFKNTFHSPVKEYFIKYIKYWILIILCFIPSYLLTKNIKVTNIFLFGIKGIIIFLVTTTTFILLTMKTEEFKNKKSALLFQIKKKVGKIQ